MPIDSPEKAREYAKLSHAARRGEPIGKCHAIRVRETTAKALYRYCDITGARVSSVASDAIDKYLKELIASDVNRTLAGDDASDNSGKSGH